MNYILRRRKLGLGSCNGVKAASTTGLTWVRNDRQQPQGANFVFRWGCTSNIPDGPVVVNTAAAIHEVADKATFRKTCADAGLAPITWLSANDIDLDYDDYPLVVRRRTHHQGRFLHVCNNGNEVFDAVQKYGIGNYYISQYIPKVAEYRVFVCSGRAVWVAQKTPANPDAVAWNVAQGGRFDNVGWGEWPLRIVKTAIQAMALTKLNFGGVDIMVDDAGTPYVLEINSAPSQTSPYRQSCTAKAFDYIVNNGKATIPLVEVRGGYKKFIHPAICEEAWCHD